MLRKINFNKEISYPFLWAFISIIVILLFKRPDSIFNAQFYAEDATIFFKDAVNGTFFNAITTKYAGYYWTIHRIFAEIFGFFNIVFQPLLYSLFALVINSLILAFFSTRYFRYILENDLQRISISIFLSIMYLDSYEMINVFINTKWYMTIFLFLFLMADESIINSRIKKIFFAGIVILIFWTQPQAFYLLPIFIMKFFISKERLFYFIVLGISIFHPILIFISGGMPSSHLESGNLSYFGLLIGVTLKSNLYFIFGSLMSKYLISFMIISIILYAIILKIGRNIFSRYFLFSYFYVVFTIIFTLVKKKEVTVALANNGLSITPYYFLLINTLTLLILLIIIFRTFNKNIYSKIVSCIFILLLFIFQMKNFHVKEFEDNNWIQNIYNASICRESVIKVNPTPWSVKYINPETDYELFFKSITKIENTTLENNSFSMHPFPDKKVSLSFFIPNCINNLKLKLAIRKLPMIVENIDINNFGSVKVNIYKDKEIIYSNVINTLAENEIVNIKNTGYYTIEVDSNGPNTYDWFYIDVLTME